MASSSQKSYKKYYGVCHWNMSRCHAGEAPGEHKAGVASDVLHEEREKKWSFVSSLKWKRGPEVKQDVKFKSHVSCCAHKTWPPAFQHRQWSVSTSKYFQTWTNCAIPRSCGPSAEATYYKTRVTTLEMSKSGSLLYRGGGRQWKTITIR